MNYIIHLYIPFPSSHYHQLLLSAVNTSSELYPIPHSILNKYHIYLHLITKNNRKLTYLNHCSNLYENSICYTHHKKTKPRQINPLQLPTNLQLINALQNPRTSSFSSTKFVSSWKSYIKPISECLYQAQKY